MAVKKASVAVLDTLFGPVALEAFHGRKVRIHGFGTFQAKHKEARTAHNPVTGEEVHVPAKDELVLKASESGWFIRSDSCGSFHGFRCLQPVPFVSRELG
ncbi:HU family DNA-binding protein [Thiomonas sp.]